jgi:hypothetical protein
MIGKSAESPIKIISIAVRGFLFNEHYYTALEH